MKYQVKIVKENNERIVEFDLKCGGPHRVDVKNIMVGDVRFDGNKAVVSLGSFMDMNFPVQIEENGQLNEYQYTKAIVNSHLVIDTELKQYEIQHVETGMTEHNYPIESLKGPVSNELMKQFNDAFTKLDEYLKEHLYTEFIGEA